MPKHESWMRRAEYVAAVAVAVLLALGWIYSRVTGS